LEADPVIKALTNCPTVKADKVETGLKFVIVTEPDEIIETEEELVVIKGWNPRPVAPKPVGPVGPVTPAGPVCPAPPPPLFVILYILLFSYILF
jgi:hypothetical protein